MKVLGRASSYDWPHTFTGDVRAVTVTVGEGAVLGVSQSACLVGGVPVGTSHAGQRAAVRDPATAALSRPALEYVPSTYGVQVRAADLQDVGAGTYRLALGAPATAASGFQFDLPPGVRELTARIHAADVLRVIGADGDTRLILKATLSSGATETRTLDVRLDSQPPTGSVTASRAGPYLYLTYAGLSRDVTQFRLQDALGEQVLERPVGERGSVGVIIGEARGDVSEVYAVDEAGNVSLNLLARQVSAAGLVDTGPGTAFALWPLPPYLRPSAPVLGGLLAAFEAGLNIGADRAGEALALGKASGAELDRLSAYYGVTRRTGETDAAMTARVQARFLPGKGTRAGLMRELASADGGAVEVSDQQTHSAEARQLDGTWALDGSVNLGGGYGSSDVGPGEVNVTFPRAPLAGWINAGDVVRRRKAAGVVPHVRFLVETHAVTGLATGHTLSMTVDSAPAEPLTRAGGTRYASVLILDGSWDLEGTEQIDGARDSATDF